ncbi:MAG: AbrB/MazE/SpoVT family DNA-binding domain-containing protein [Thermoplasmata archaeon]|nr:AbrB/MazE/SpoVT family DNA-binding domain-containing protein [Thermoplasmata archaeon]
MPKAKSAAKKLGATESGACCGEDCCGGGISCCGMPAVGCCEVEAVVGVDGRGQMVLPKEIREKAGIKPDDKLAVVTWKKGDEVCCLTLLKVDSLAEAIRTAYGPMLTEILHA